MLLSGEQSGGGGHPIYSETFEGYPKGRSAECNPAFGSQAVRL